MFLSLIIRLAANSLMFYILDSFLSSVTFVGGWKSYLLAGIILGLLNMFIKPLLNIIALPFRILTLGLFTFVINAILLYLIVQGVTSLHIEDIRIIIGGWQDYAITSIVFTILNGIIHLL